MFLNVLYVSLWTKSPCSPVSEVSPMQPAAMMTPNTAAASSSSTTLVLGSRLCITVHTKQRRTTFNTQMWRKQIHNTQTWDLSTRGWHTKGNVSLPYGCLISVFPSQYANQLGLNDTVCVAHVISPITSQVDRALSASSPHNALGFYSMWSCFTCLYHLFLSTSTEITDHTVSRRFKLIKTSGWSTRTLKFIVTPGVNGIHSTKN